MKIDIPRLLLELRSEVIKSNERESRGRLERWGFKLWAWAMRHPLLYEMGGLAAQAVMPVVSSFGPLKAWRSQRDIPEVAPKSFRRMWREQGRG